MANCIYRGFPWRKFPIYFVAQLLGAMAAAAVVYGNNVAAIDNFEGGPGIRTVGLDTSTAGIFCTYPAAFMSRTGMFFDEFVASSILMFCIFAFVDAGAGELMPLCLFFLIFGIGATFGWQTGYAINLARDFGPRLVTYLLGYGSEVWSAGNYYFWVSFQVATQLRLSSSRHGIVAAASLTVSRFPWLCLSLVVRSADSCTMSSYTKAKHPSTARGWVSVAFHRHHEPLASKDQETLAMYEAWEQAHVLAKLGYRRQAPGDPCIRTLLPHESRSIVPVMAISSDEDPFVQTIKIILV